jgi:hypothetical protein
VIARHQATGLQRGADRAGLVVDLAHDTNPSPSAGATEWPTNRTPVGRSAAATRRSTIEPGCGAMGAASAVMKRNRSAAQEVRRIQRPMSSTSDTPLRAAARLPVHRRARAGDRATLAGLVGRARHVPHRQPERPAGRRGVKDQPEAVRARHVPVPERHRPARRPSAGLHRHRRLQPVPAHDRAQRAVHDGLRRVRSAGRAVRGADRPAPGRHHRRERRQHAPPAAPDRPEPRPAPQHRHHRPGLLPLDAVDLQPDLQRLVRHRPEDGPSDQRAGRRVRRRHPRHARRTCLGRR